MPSSRMISLATPRKESSVLSEEGDRGSSEFRPTCCRVAITETGIVNIWASAPASAPSDNSAAVDNGESFDPGARFRVSLLMYAVLTKE